LFYDDLCSLLFRLNFVAHFVLTILDFYRLGHLTFDRFPWRFNRFLLNLGVEIQNLQVSCGEALVELFAEKSLPEVKHVKLQQAMLFAWLLLLELLFERNVLSAAEPFLQVAKIRFQRRIFQVGP